MTRTGWKWLDMAEMEGMTGNGSNGLKWLTIIKITIMILENQMG